MADAATTTATTQALIDLLPLAKGIAFGLSAAGAAIGIAMVFVAAIQGIARQPEQTATLRTLAFIGMAFIEALALIGFVLTLIMK